MTRLVVAHTGQLSPADLTACRTLFDNVFGPGPTDQDWDHSLGGMHALVWDGDELVGEGSLVQRRLLHGGRALRAGCVEGVAVRPDRRREGHGATVMEALEELARNAYEVGMLSATEAGGALYSARGWHPFRGTTSALTPEGVVRTPDEDDGVFLLLCSASIDLDGALTCDWRDGDVW